MEPYDRVVDRALELGFDPEKYMLSLLERRRKPAMPDYSAVRIKATCVCPPIPTRNHDWQAIDDNSFDADWDGEAERYVTDCPIGEGPTQAAAVVDLIEKIAERDDEDPLQVLFAVCYPNTLKEPQPCPAQPEA